MKKEEIKLDALKLIAESYGFELVEKKREIKVGDFGKFWDEKIDGFIYGFITQHDKSDQFRFECNNFTWWQNFRHLTDEEKQAITENW